MANYENKIVIVTGASSGMGRETALFLAQKGVKSLTLFARRQDALQEVAKQVEALGAKALVVAGDAGKDDDNKRMVEETVKTFGGVSSIFINAGVYRGGTPLDQTSDQVVEDILDVNIKGVIYALRHSIPAIKDTVKDNEGSIVINSSSMGAAVIGPKSAGSGIYSASKAFVNSLVETAAIENAPLIRVNGVLPGVVQTSIMPVDNDTYQKIGASMQPLYGRPGQAKEIASLVAYLLSDEATFISGANIKADGLWSMSGGSFS